jgi:arylsulfatase
MRVPTIMRWPGKIPAGAVQHEIASLLDLLPTFAHIAGVKLAPDRIIDGKNIWPLMTGQADARSPHDAIYHYERNTDRLAAVRVGEWKFHAAHGDEPEQLYNLTSDIGEADNVAADHPQIVARLKHQMERFDADVKANRRSSHRVSEQ